MQKTILFHDGCNVCLSIESAFNSLFSNGQITFESVNLGLDNSRSAEAVQLGVTRLPSLVLEGKVLRIDDHSPIEHYLTAAAVDLF
nr:hypothetical protein [uncultured Undibacterium sp.]